MTAYRALALFALTATLLVGLAVTALAQTPVYPEKSWSRVVPDQIGWSADKLKEAQAYAATIDTAAVMIVVGGRVLDEWGETATRFNVHSIRKS